ncbi:MAG: type II CRISPR RNA-guided endonuclease Cas9 [Bacteroidales bacterium]|nr:type II CRISPR RNA-guided endonuclease Cas9 [Candidatus Sodaliphilus aphodohippi]
MKRILGLDLGTTSIGWAVVDQAENENEKSDIIKIGVRVNPLTVDEKSNFESGKSITTTADRTMKRGMRRNLQRYKLRRNALIDILKKNNLINDSTILSEEGSHSTFETLRLRAKATKEEITLSELARVLLMLNKKRGYKSNRKANNQEEGQLIDGMAVARKLYEDGLTPGQYTYNILQSGKNFVPSFYRSDLQDELDKIWAYQKQYYPEILTPEFKEQLQGRGSKDISKIFFAKHNIQTAENKDRKTRRLVAYRWRTESLTQKTELPVLAYVIGAISSDINNCSGYLGAIGDHSKELYFNKMTVGEYLVAQINKDPHYRIKDRVYYRQDYLHEFNVIWERQAQFHPELTPELKTELRDVIIFYQRRLKSKKGLIAYCEFEGKEITINENGKTRKVMTGPRVCAKSSPLFQESKVWQAINNVEIGDGNTTRSLTQLERQLLHDELTVNKELSKPAILKLLGLKGKNYTVNYDKLQGNTTTVTFFDAFKTILDWSGHDVDGFDKLGYADKVHFVRSVFEGIGAKTDFIIYKGGDNYTADPFFKLWHLIYSYEDDNSATGNEKLIEHIATMTGLSQEYAATLANINFAEDYGSLSSKALNKIMPHLIAGHKYSEACELAGYRHSKESLTREEIDNKPLLPNLEILQKNSLRNPVVEKIINQMIHVVNAAMEEYGTPDENGLKRFDEIHIEMARDLKQSAKEREDATKALRERTAESEKIVEILQTDPAFNIARPSRNDILRYRLYQELAPNGYKTLYSNTYIKKENLFSRDFDIEHIIPQALCFDDSYSNKTIETRKDNEAKGKMTALDYVRQAYGKDGEERFLKTIEDLYAKEHRGKLKKLKTTGNNIPEDFLNRDLNDTRYISSKARELLRDVTRTVVVTIGSITDTLREDWGLIDVMKELNWDKYDKLGLTETYVNPEGHQVRRINDWTKRNDHRHHAMDAITVAFTRLEHTQYLNSLNARDNDGKFKPNVFALRTKLKTENGKGKSIFIAPLPVGEFRELVKRHMESTLISIKAKNKVVTRSVNRAHGVARHQNTLTPRTQLHNETVYGTQQRYVTKMETVNGSFDIDKIKTVANKMQRQALLKRLEEYGGDAKKAFTGKNSPKKNPIYLNTAQTAVLPEKVKTVSLERVFTIRKPIDKDLKIEKVMDAGIREILRQRLADYDGKADKAFGNLDENPIWLNKEKGIAIKRVTISGVSVAEPLHEKKDKDGRPMLDSDGNNIPVDYVSTSNNHHVAIFSDEDGNLHEHVVSYFEALARINAGLPVVDKVYNREQGWKFLYTMKRNEYFVFPDADNGFSPEEIDLTDPNNYPVISKHLYRVQKLATKNYMFRHHYETNVECLDKLKNIAYILIQSENRLKGIVKVRINHIGKIVAVGEYD